MQAVQRFHTSWVEDMENFAQTMVDLEVSLLDQDQRCISEVSAGLLLLLRDTADPASMRRPLQRSRITRFLLINQ